MDYQKFWRLHAVLSFSFICCHFITLSTATFCNHNSTELRDQLERVNCLREVEIVDPTEILRAVRLFYRDGYVVVRNALSEQQTTELRTSCHSLAEQILANDKLKLGNRGPMRWSLSAASKTGHLLHVPEFANLVDLPTITPILKAIFGNEKSCATKEYALCPEISIPRGGTIPEVEIRRSAVDEQSNNCKAAAYRKRQMQMYPFTRCASSNKQTGKLFSDKGYICRGARGDFNLPGAVYQDLHSDVWHEFLVDSTPTEFDNAGKLNYRDLPVFYVVVNFNVINITALSAPIRQIPLTQRSQQTIPSFQDEPLWMKTSTLCPLPAGSAIIRDPRAWHGGTPNLGKEMRCMPNVEYYASWFRFQDKTQQMTISMPRHIFDNLTDFGKKLCREVVAPVGITLDTAPKPTAQLLYAEYEDCYRQLGLTDELLRAYVEAGGSYLQTIQDVTTADNQAKVGYYMKRSDTSDLFVQARDEL